MKHSVILDVDTGIDDAMAIMFAVSHPDVDVKAISCVSGNVSVDKVVANTLAVLDLVGAPEIPVAAGARRPLIEPARHASWVHGENGLANLDLPTGSRVAEDVHAVELLRRELMAADEPLTIIALAPLTNLALLLRTYPEVADRVARIVFMGGSASVGNASAVAEFNIWHDPEAASIVFFSGVPMTMYGLDVFNVVEVSASRVAELRASEAPIMSALGDLLGFEMLDPANGNAVVHSLIGDAGAVCALVAPELFSFESWPMQVELAPGLSRGQTIVDRRTYSGEDLVYGPEQTPWPVVDVALGVDSERVLELFFGALATARV